MRKSHTTNEKAKLVLEVFKGEQTLSEIATANDIHPNMLTRWKTQAVKGMSTIFENESVKSKKQQKEQEAEKEELYRQIGRLSAQIEWLKKKAGE